MNSNIEIRNTLATEFARFISENPSLVKKIHTLLENPSLPGEGKSDKNSNPAFAFSELNHQIRNLQVQLENDSMLILKPENRQPLPYNCRQLGFRNERSKTWRFLREVLASSRPVFQFGTAYHYPEPGRRVRVKNKVYDAQWKLCNAACEKLIDFLTQTQGWSFPKNFKLYERNPEGPEGERRFKFQVRPPETDLLASPASYTDLPGWDREFSELKELDLISEINRLNDDFTLQSTDGVEPPDRLVRAIQVGQQRFGWSDDYLRSLLTG